MDTTEFKNKLTTSSLGELFDHAAKFLSISELAAVRNLLRSAVRSITFSKILFIQRCDSPVTLIEADGHIWFGDFKVILGIEGDELAFGLGTLHGIDAAIFIARPSIGEITFDTRMGILNSEEGRPLNGDESADERWNVLAETITEFSCASPHRIAEWNKAYVSPNQAAA